MGREEQRPDDGGYEALHRCVPWGKSLSEEESKVQRSQGAQTNFIGLSSPSHKPNFSIGFSFLGQTSPFAEFSRLSTSAWPGFLPPVLPLVLVCGASRSCQFYLPLGLLPSSSCSVSSLALLCSRFSDPYLPQPPYWSLCPDGLPSIDRPKPLLNLDQMVPHPC